MPDDGEVLLGDIAIAQELSRLLGREVHPKTANYWIKRKIIRAKKAGHFHAATRTSLREDFQPAEEG
jgi:hypothetical protein